MTLNTAERFLLLIQHPKKQGFVIPYHIKNAGLAGAVLLDLASEKKITLDNGKVVVASADTDLSRAHKLLLEEMSNSDRTRKVKAWIQRFARKPGKYQKEIVEELVNKRIIRILPKSFLGIKYYRTRLVNPMPRQQLVHEIRDGIFYHKEISAENIPVLGLIEACRMHQTVAKNRKEARACRRKLKEMIKSDTISKEVDQVIREMNAAIIGAVVVTTVATHAGTR